ncbi:MAG: hypothetical protein HRT52_04815 [Colwellia sp.]|nr:hypothetical protein [Colwellia sp.]
MTNNKFAIHGQYKLSTSDNIIVIEAEGPWNLEFFQQMHDDFRAAYHQLDKNNYAILFIPHGETIAISEALTLHESFVLQGNAKGIAINLQYSSTPLSGESMFRQVYEKTGLKHAFFDNTKDAKSWLEQLLS